MSRGAGLVNNKLVISRAKKVCSKSRKLSRKPETIGLVSVRNGKYTQITQSQKNLYRWLLGSHAWIAGVE